MITPSTQFYKELKLQQEKISKKKELHVVLSGGAPPLSDLIGLILWSESELTLMTSVHQITNNPFGYSQMDYW